MNERLNCTNCFSGLYLYFWCWYKIFCLYFWCWYQYLCLYFWCWYQHHVDLNLFALYTNTFCFRCLAEDSTNVSLLGLKFQINVNVSICICIFLCIFVFVCISDVDISICVRHSISCWCQRNEHQSISSRKEFPEENIARWKVSQVLIKKELQNVTERKLLKD